jgi:hypothetical protein
MNKADDILRSIYYYPSLSAAYPAGFLPKRTVAGLRLQDDRLDRSKWFKHLAGLNSGIGGRGQEKIVLSMHYSRLFLTRSYLCF